jgi:hypothetical protein
MLAFPWFTLAESGLFKGLRVKKVKKFHPAQLAFSVVGDIPRARAAAPFLLAAGPARDGAATRR